MAIEVRRRYRDKDNFLLTFNPGKQIEYCKHTDRIFRGKAPTIGLVSQVYGSAVSESWLEIQIKDLSEFAGCKEKLTVPQIEQTAITILHEYGYLKVTELMYFFFLFKSGRFGRFYGAVDPLVITTSLREFMKIRDHEQERLIRAERQRERIAKEQEQQRNAMTYEEWNELRWLFNMGYERNS